MAKSWNRTETWLTLIVLGVGVVTLGLGGLWVYVSATTPTLHPNAQEVTSVVGAAPAERWAGAIAQGRQAVRAAVADFNLPGVSVAVGTGGEVVWAEGFGWADLEKRVPVAPHTRFRVGSASPALTSAAVGLLVESERLKLDEKIHAYVPEYPEQRWPVTLRQVMGHTAGLRSDSGDEGPLFGEQCDRPVEALRHFNAAPRVEPGTEYRFSNFGWILVSAAVETVTGEPFLAFMRKQVFEPLGMQHTEADFVTDAPAQDRTTFYFPRFAADPRYGPDLIRPLNYSCYAGASVFLSTPSDLVRFLMAIDGGKLLQPATVQLLRSPQRLANGQETGYGLGWDLETETLAGKSTALVGHDGEILGGMTASFMSFPEHGIAVAVMSNTSYADTYALSLKIAEAFAKPRS